MSAMLNLVGLATLMVMSAALLNGAGIPVTSYLHAAIDLVKTQLPFHLP